MTIKTLEDSWDTQVRERCMGMRTLFVYGTLKQGFHNHYFLQDLEADFIGKATSTEKYTLYNHWGLPYVRKPLEGEEGNIIKGEAYALNHLLTIDALESHPIHYRRELKTFLVQNPNNTQQAITMPCFVYFEAKPNDMNPECLEEWTLNPNQ